MKLPGWITAAATAVVAALLPACDAVNLPRIEPGRTTADEVRARLGEPGFEFAEADGGVTWEYSRQPSGVHCYMITLGPDRVVHRLEQVLNEANYARARPGLRPDEVRRLYGQPASKTVFDNLGEEIWEWRIEGTPPTEESYFMVHFDLATGALKRTSKRVAARG